MKEHILIWAAVIFVMAAIIVDYKMRPVQEPYKGKYVGATADIMKKLYDK